MDNSEKENNMKKEAITHGVLEDLANRNDNWDKLDGVINQVNELDERNEHELGENNIIRSIKNGVSDEFTTENEQFVFLQNTKHIPLPQSGWVYTGKTNNDNFHVIFRSLVVGSDFDGISTLLEPTNRFELSETTFVPYSASTLQLVLESTKKSVVQRWTYNAMYLVIPNEEYTQATDNVGANEYITTNLSNVTVTYKLSNPIVLPLPNPMTPNTIEIVRLSEQIKQLTLAVITQGGGF